MTLKTISKITLPNVYGTSTICFSPNGKRIICSGLDDDHTIFLIDTDSQSIVAKTTSGNSKVLDIAFKSDTEFISVAIKHYKFWTITNKKELICKNGEFPQGCDYKIGVVTVIKDTIITGSSSGYVSNWKDEKFALSKKIHQGNVDTIFSNNEVIITGSRDSSIAILDKNLTELQRIQMNTEEIDSIMAEPWVRSIEVYMQETNR